VASETWRKRGRHFDRVFTMDVSDGRTFLTLKALGELARLVNDDDETHLPVLVPASEVQRLLTLAGYEEQR
jgi:hypothetical protein